MILFGKLCFVLFLLPLISNTSDSDKSDLSDSCESNKSGPSKNKNKNENLENSRETISNESKNESWKKQALMELNETENENLEQQHPVEPNETEKSDQCIFCLELLGSDPAMVLQWKECGHKFHNDCVMKWKKLNRKCPICRQEDKSIRIKENKKPYIDVTDDLLFAHIVELIQVNRQMNAASAQSRPIKRCELCEVLIPKEFDVCDRCQHSVEESTNQQQKKESINIGTNHLNNRNAVSSQSQPVKCCELCGVVISNQFVRCETCERIVEESSNQQQNKSENYGGQKGNKCFQCGKDLPFNVSKLNRPEMCEECMTKDSHKNHKMSGLSNQNILNQSRLPLDDVIPKFVVNRCSVCKDVIAKRLKNCEECEHVLNDSALIQTSNQLAVLHSEENVVNHCNVCNIVISNGFDMCDSCKRVLNDSASIQTPKKIAEQQEPREKIQQMLHAAQRGNTQEVILMVTDGVNVNAMMQNTALHLAAREGHDGCLELLLDLGADVFKLNARNQSVLSQYIHAIYYQRGSMKGLRMLVERGARLSPEAREFLKKQTQPENEPTKLLTEAAEFLMHLPN